MKKEKVEARPQDKGGKAAEKAKPKGSGSKEVSKEKKESGKSLWVSNLSSVTKAVDLKTRFSQYGKVRQWLLLRGQ